MDLRQMEYLLAVAAERHFTRAAELTGISQSGLSAAIRSLEEEMGAALFDRSTRRVELTEAGAALVPYARDILAQAAAARDAVVTASADVTGALCVGAEQCLGFVDVAFLLERFHRRHPRVETRFVQAGSHELLTMSRAGEADVVFVAGAHRLGSQPHQSLGQEPLVLLVSEAHPLAGRARVAWEDLAGEDFIDFASTWGVRSLNDEMFASRTLGRRVRCTVTDVHMLLDLVIRGLGIAIVPRHVAAKKQAAPLRALTLPDDALHWNVSVVLPRWDRSGALAAHLLDLLDVPGAAARAVGGVPVS